jgi:hypothetical protein
VRQMGGKEIGGRGVEVEVGVYEMVWREEG